MSEVSDEEAASACREVFILLINNREKETWEFSDVGISDFRRHFIRALAYCPDNPCFLLKSSISSKGKKIVCV
jgi:hypothetical protein